MMKRIMSMLMVMVLMVSVLSVSVFAEGEHTHSWSSTDYKSDANGHWFKCTDDCTVTTFEQAQAVTEAGAAAHVDTATVDGVCDTCGYVMHTHTWGDYASDDTNHWKNCTVSGCFVTDNAAKEGYGAHTWVFVPESSNSAQFVYKCVCGKTKTESHTHSFDTAWSTDNTYHWHAATCTPCSTNGIVSGKEAHVDANNDNVCDVCNFLKKITTIAITDLDNPVEGKPIDFDVTVTPNYGSAKVYWNRSATAKGAATAMYKGATYAADYMYSVGILLTPYDGFAIDSNPTITVNGVNVPFYATKAEADAVIATYTGTSDIRVAYKDANGKIMIGIMYAEVPGDHTCVWQTGADNWTESSAQHWRACSGCGKGVKDAGAHYDKNNNKLCDVCGFDMTKATPVHTHSWSSDWVEDLSNHWHQCTTCGAIKDKAGHFDTYQGGNGKCDVCGFVLKAATGHTHSYATTWTTTFAQHYKVCSCGAKNEIGAHVDNNKDKKCDTCGYAMTTLVNSGYVADTGDETPIALWIAVLALSVVGIGGVAFVVAKKKREE